MPSSYFPGFFPNGTAAPEKAGFFAGLPASSGFKLSAPPMSFLGALFPDLGGVRLDDELRGRTAGVSSWSSFPTVLGWMVGALGVIWLGGFV